MRIRAVAIFATWLVLSVAPAALAPILHRAG